MKKRLIFYFGVLLLANMFIPAHAATQPELGEQIISETAVLMDADTGQVLFEKNMHQKMNPASITKVMTALLALENGNLSDTITMSHDAVFSVGRDTSHIALDVDEQLTLEQALYALALESANDASNGIAEYVSGTMDDFAALMTHRAKEAGALNTNFTNAHGLTEENHYTTAYDMARITMEAAKLQELSKIFMTEKYDMPPTNKQPEERHFWCRNAMVVGDYKYDGIIVEKTGWTDEALHTLVTAARRNGRTLIALVMKSSHPNDKWKDTTSLLDYGFDDFENLSFTAAELAKEHYSFTGPDGIDTDYNLTASGSFNCLIPKQLTKADVKIEYVDENGNSNSGLRVRAVFSINPSVSTQAFSELGSIEMRAVLNEVDAAEAVALVTDDSSAIEAKKINLPLKLIFILIGIISALALAFVLLLIRRHLIIRRRRRMRRRRFEQYRDYR